MKVTISGKYSEEVQKEAEEAGWEEILTLQLENLFGVKGIVVNKINVPKKTDFPKRKDK